MSIFKVLLSSFLIVSFSLVTVAQMRGPNEKAAKYLGEGRFQDAIAELDKDIEKERNLFHNYKFRGMIRSMAGNFRGAFDDYTRALEIDSSDGSIYEQRASLRMFLGQDSEQILPDLDLAISRGVKTQRIHSQRGMIRLMMGDTDGSLSDYKIAAGLDPNNAASAIGLANAYSDKGETAEAVSILENFILRLESSNVPPERLTENVIVRTQTTDVQVKSTKNVRVGVDAVIYENDSPTFDGPPTKEQIESMNAAMEQKRNIPQVYATLARLYKIQGQYENGLNSINKGIDLSGSDFSMYEMRGTIKAKLGDLAGGLADLNRSLDLNSKPRSAIYLERGIIYLMMGDEDSSQKDFDKYLEAFPNGNTYLEKRIAEARKESGAK